jgi:hypothetical protein
VRREIITSIILLSGILITECATNRVFIKHKEDLACKTPNIRYDFGKNKPIRPIESKNIKYIKYILHSTRNFTHNNISSNNISRSDNQSGKLIHDFGESKNYHRLVHSNIKELMSLQEILKSSEINPNHYELRKLPTPVRTIYEPKDNILIPTQKDILCRINKVKNEISYSYVVSEQEDMNNIIPKESSDEPGISILNTLKSDQSTKTPFHKSETYILMMAFVAGLIQLATIKATPNIVTNISFWAAMNPWKTRFMFATIQIALGITGVLLGERLADNGIHFSGFSRDLLLGAFLTSSMLYPVKGTSIKLFKHSYLRQKAFDLALVISGLLLMVNAGNDPGMRASMTNMVTFIGHEQQDVNIINDNSQASKQLVYYQNEKQLQDNQTAPRKNETSKGAKGLFTFLVVLATLVLGCLLAIAACGIYCNGMVGLAFLVGIGGGGLLIGLAIWVIKSIWHPKHKNRMKPSISV